MTSSHIACWRNCIFSKKRPCVIRITKICPGFVSTERAAKELQEFVDILLKG